MLCFLLEITQKGEVGGPSYDTDCNDRRLFICVQRHANVTCGRTACVWPSPCCGKGATATCCCGSSTCCDKAVCCHAGTKCCPKRLTKPAYCQAPNVPC